MEITIKEIKHSDNKKFSVTLFDSVTGFSVTRVFDDSKLLFFYLNFWL